MAKYNCINNFDALTGDEPSLLYPELLAEYGDGALEKFRQADQALRDGRFASRKTHVNGEPTLKSVKELIARGELNPITAAMVNQNYLQRVTELVDEHKLIINNRIKRLTDSRTKKSALAVDPRNLKETSKLKERLEAYDAKGGYVAMALFADLQLRNIKDFLDNTFNAQAAADSNAKDGQGTSLDEIRMQLAHYQGVFQPELAVHDSALQELIVGGPNGAIGLNEQLRLVTAALDKAQNELQLLVGMKHANREGLTKEEFGQHVAGGKDVGSFARWLGGASSSASKLLAAVFDIVEQARQRFHDRFHSLKHGLSDLKTRMVKAGITDSAFMLRLDKNNLSAGKVIQRIGEDYHVRRMELQQAVDEAGPYVQGSNLSAEDIAHNLRANAARVARREFNNAESIVNGKAVDGTNHRYTDEFKRERARFEALVQNGQSSEWARKQGLHGYNTQEEADEAYAIYQATYYGEPTKYDSMKQRYVNGVAVPTGEVVEKIKRFPRYSTKEVVEDRWRDARYQQLLNDTSVAGKLRLEFFNKYHELMDSFERMLPKDDGAHVRKGGIPPMIAAVQSLYNGKWPGYLDTMGRVVSNPVATLQGLLSAAEMGKQGVRVGEDGGILKDVDKKFTGTFRDQAKIDRLQAKVEALNALAQAGPLSAEQKADLKQLTYGLTVEQNRLQASHGETDLFNVLMAFGASSMHYEEFKEQEGTINLFRHAVRNREYYELDGQGNYKLGPDGQPLAKKNYQPQLEAQLNDFLDQCFYVDNGSDKSQAELLARTVKQYVSITYQALNPASALKNLLAGIISTSIYSAGEQLGFNKKQMREARSEFIMDGANIATDRLADRMNPDKVTIRPHKSKVDAVMQLGLEEHEFQLTGQGVLTEIGFAGITLGEYGISACIGVAKLKSIILTGLDGQTKDAWSAMSLGKNGQLTLDPNYAAAWEAKRHRAVADIKNIIKHTQGNHSADDKAAMEKHALGMLVAQFKRWAYNFYRNRFGEQYYDEGFAASVEGHYRGVIRLLKAMHELGLKGGYYHSLSKHDQALVRQAAQELKYVLGTAALLLIAEGLKPKPDDKDKHLLYLATNFFERVMNGVQGEVTAGVDPIQLYNTLKSPIASLGILRDGGVFVKNIALAGYYESTGQEDLMNYQSGALKGKSKLWHSTKAFLPGVRAITRLHEQISTTGTMWIQ